VADLSTTNLESCKRELAIEVPAEDVAREVERATQYFQQHARVAGFRPGKTPAGLVRQRFRKEIREEVVERLASEHFRRKVAEENLHPVTAPEIQDLEVDLEGKEPMRFKATFEALPEFELKDYTGLEIEQPDATVSEEEVAEALRQLQQEQTTYAAVEDRPLRDGDVAAVSIEGQPMKGKDAADDAAGKKSKPAGGETVKVNDLLCEIGGADTLPAFSENLRGMSPGEEKTFPVSYPDEYADGRLAGRTLQYSVRVNGVKQKQVPELDDDFAKELSFNTIEEARQDVRQKLQEQKRRRAEREARDKLVDRLLDLHSFPLPDSLVERQLQSRMERTVRQLAARGVNPAKLQVDWSQVRSSQREAALRDVKADILLDRIAEREDIQVSNEEVERETEQLARQLGGKDPAAARARLTRQPAADRIKERLRDEKTVDFLYSKARIVPGGAGREEKP
jgi:trigger factor